MYKIPASDHSKFYQNVYSKQAKINMQYAASLLWRAHCLHHPAFRPYESDLGHQGKLWGGMKCSRECLDCCHSGKDTAIKLSSEVTRRSVRQDRPWTWHKLINKRSNSDGHYFHRTGIHIYVIVPKHVKSWWDLPLLHTLIAFALLLFTFYLQLLNDTEGPLTKPPVCRRELVPRNNRLPAFIDRQFPHTHTHTHTHTHSAT